MTVLKNQQDNLGNTILHYLCMRGNLELLLTLINTSDGMDVKNNDGETPLDCAIKHEHYHIVDYFKNLDKQKALDYAIKFGLDDVVEHLKGE